MNRSADTVVAGGMSHLGRRILEAKRARARLADLRDHVIGTAQVDARRDIARMTALINALACTAAKNW